MKHPIQPLAPDSSGTLRFKENKIVRYLLDTGGIDLNRLAVLDFPQEDREQFAQLIGYSLGGFGELSYVSDATYRAAAAMAESGETGERAKIQALEEQLADIKAGLRVAACAAFNIHPEDLT